MFEVGQIVSSQARCVDLRFLSWWMWRIWPSGMWHYVSGTDIVREPLCQATCHHIPEDHNLKIHFYV